MLIVISGPSGCGKTTLVKRALAEIDGLFFSISHTTRKKRDSETDGLDYYFVSPSEFEEKIRRQEFAEWAEVHGNYYGTSKKEIEKKNKQRGLILDVDIQGAKQIKAQYPDALLVFIFPPEFRVLKQRLIERGDEMENSILKRLDRARTEILSYSEFDCFIINDRLEEAVQDLKDIILSGECLPNGDQNKIEPILESFSIGS